MGEEGWVVEGEGLHGRVVIDAVFSGGGGGAHHGGEIGESSEEEEEAHDWRV